MESRTSSYAFAGVDLVPIRLRSLREVLCTHPNSIGISWLPLFHDMGLIAGVLEPLWVGYPAYLMSPAAFVQSPLRWLRAFSRYGGTIGGGPNFAYQACVDAARASDVRDLDLSAWEMAWNGAEPVRASTLEHFRDTFAVAGFRPESLTPSFGLAEATLLVSANNGATPAFELVIDELDLGNVRVRECAADSPRAKRLVASGRAAPGIQVRIVEPETRILRTGDLGFVHGGELFVTGRLKDVIVIRGVNLPSRSDVHGSPASADAGNRVASIGARVPGACRPGRHTYGRVHGPQRATRRVRCPAAAAGWHFLPVSSV